MKQDLLKIINHYGVLPQLKYFQSEVFELNEAIIKYEWTKNLFNEGEEWTKDEEDKHGLKHIVEEIADVLVMLYQFLYHYDVDELELCKIMDFKVNRQLERITNELQRNS